MKRNVFAQTILTGTAICLLTLATGCRSSRSAGAVAAAPEPGAPVPTAPASVTARETIRVNAGSYEAYTDPAGNRWQTDRGFQGGDVIERPGLEIANTEVPELYRSERYAMDSFSWEVPNGRYLARLHFAETFEGIYGRGERVFSFKLHGREFKDFDVWAKAGGANRAYVESVPVEVTNGKFEITFTSNIENPQICAIELIPQ